MLVPAVILLNDAAVCFKTWSMRKGLILSVYGQAN